MLLCFGLVRLVPIRLTPLLARFTGTLAYLFTPKRVRIAGSNLHSVFPRLSESQTLQIIKALYCNLAGNAVDFVRPAQMVERIVLSRDAEAKLREIRKILESGRPVIFLSGHYGDWETLAHFLGSRFENVHFLAKRQRNALVDGLINRIRTNLGGKIIPSHRAPRTLLRLFGRGGNSFLFVADQEGGPDGVVVDFLGRPTSYARGPALYGHRYNAPLALIFLKRENPGFTLLIDGIIEPDPSADRKEEVERIIGEYSNALARRVEEHPEQWLWTHRRWKSNPQSM